MLGASAAIFALAGCVMPACGRSSFPGYFFAPQGLIAILYFIYNVVVSSTRRAGYRAMTRTSLTSRNIIGFLTGSPFGNCAERRH